MLKSYNNKIQIREGADRPVAPIKYATVDKKHFVISLKYFLSILIKKKNPKFFHSYNFYFINIPVRKIVAIRGYCPPKPPLKYG